MVEKLPVGEYTLREEQAPDGYLIAEDVKFTVKDTGKSPESQNEGRTSIWKTGHQKD